MEMKYQIFIWAKDMKNISTFKYKRFFHINKKIDLNKINFMNT